MMSCIPPPAGGSSTAGSPSSLVLSGSAKIARRPMRVSAASEIAPRGSTLPSVWISSESLS